MGQIKELYRLILELDNSVMNYGLASFQCGVKCNTQEFKESSKKMFEDLEKVKNDLKELKEFGKELLRGVSDANY